MSGKNVLKFLFFFLFLTLFSTPVYAQEIDVKNVRVIEQSGTMTVGEVEVVDNKINSELVFNQLNDFVTLEVELKNNTDHSIELESIENLVSESFINVTTDDIDTIIYPYTSNTIKVTLTYQNELLNQRENVFNNSSIVFKFNETLINNPVTSNIFFRVLKIFFFVMILFSLPFIIKKKKLAFLFLLLLPILVYAKESKSISLEFSNIKVIGRFETYSISITNGNGEVEEVEITYGEKIDLPAVNNVPGYEFVNWTDSEGNEITSDYIITGKIEVAANYQIINYTITYDLGGGTLSSDNPNSYTVEDEITLNNPTKEGYSFSGWTGSNGEVYQTRVTINKGSIGNISFTANFSPNTDTSYKVIHRYQNLDLTSYDEVVENLTGTTDTSVSPALIPRDGFTSPSTQTITINGNGTSSLTYTYSRNQYTFVITDRTYITSSSTEDGTYYYGSTITVEAEERVGYSFKWSDNDTSYSKSFVLSGNVSLTPIYTANSGIRYTVNHYRMDLDGENYTLYATQYFTGRTDS